MSRPQGPLRAVPSTDIIRQRLARVEAERRGLVALLTVAEAIDDEPSPFNIVAPNVPVVAPEGGRRDG